MGKIEVYEFYRAFDKIRLVNGEYVSGGYSPDKINRSNYRSGDIRDIPGIIKEYVFAGYFAINDNYPPEINQFSLIAREIRADDRIDEDDDVEAYAVLAVANRQEDDGGRPTIGYRYFWIKELTNSTNDWVGILTSWWLKHRLIFDMEEAYRDIKSNVAIISEDLDQLNNDLRRNRSFSNNNSIIEYYNYNFAQNNNFEAYNNIASVTESNSHNIDPNQLHESIKAHHQARLLQGYSTFELAWAWNVNRLIYPEYFLTVYHNPESAEAKISPNIPQVETSEEDRTTIDIVSVSGVDNLRQSSVPAPNDSIRRCLLAVVNEFARDGRNKAKLVDDLINYLEDYSEANWSNFIDLTFQKNASLNERNIYDGLLALLVRDNTHVWLSNVSEFKTSKQSVSHCNMQSSGIDLQNRLIDASHNKLKATKYLQQSQENGISKYLLSLFNDSISEKEKSLRISKFLSFCTTQNNIWNDALKTYFKDFIRLINTDHKELIKSEFLVSILRNVTEINNFPRQNKFVSYRQYSILIDFCNQLNIPKDTKESLMCIFKFLAFGERSSNQVLDKLLPVFPEEQLFQDVNKIVREYTKSKAAKIKDLKLVCDQIQSVSFQEEGFLNYIENRIKLFNSKYGKPSDEHIYELLLAFLFSEKMNSWIKKSRLVKMPNISKNSTGALLQEKKYFSLQFMREYLINIYKRESNKHELWKRFENQNLFYETLKDLNCFVEFQLIVNNVNHGIDDFLFEILNSPSTPKLNKKIITKICNHQSVWVDRFSDYVNSLWGKVSVFEDFKSIGHNHISSQGESRLANQILEDLRWSKRNYLHNNIPTHTNQFSTKQYFFLADFFQTIEKNIPRNDPNLQNTLRCLIVIFYLFSGKTSNISSDLNASTKDKLNDVMKYFYFDYSLKDCPPKPSHSIFPNFQANIALGISLLLLLLVVILFIMTSLNKSSSKLISYGTWLWNKNDFQDYFFNQRQALLRGINNQYTLSHFNDDFLPYGESKNNALKTFNPSEPSDSPERTRKNKLADIQTRFIMLYLLKASYKSDDNFHKSHANIYQCTNDVGKINNSTSKLQQPDTYLSCIEMSTAARMKLLNITFELMEIDEKSSSNKQKVQNLVSELMIHEE